MSLGTEVAPVAPDADVELEPTETPAEQASPAPAEAPAVPAEGAEPPSPETPPASDVPRDELGRFTKADGSLSEPGEAAPPAKPPAPEAEPDLSAYEPFSFRAEGQPQAYEGAVQDDEGNVLFTPAAVQQLKHDLAYARAYPRRDAEAQRDLTREQTARQAAEATTQAVLGKLEQLFDQSQGASTIEELMATPLGQWILQRHAEWPKLRAEGLQRGFDLKSKAMEAELQSFRTRELESRQRPLMLGRVEEAVRHWGPEAGLDTPAQNALIRQFTTGEMLDVIFPRVSQDDPISGLKAGQRAENLEVIRRELLVLQGLLKSRTAGPSAQAVKDENARRTGQSGTKPPPMVGGSKSGTTRPSKVPAYRSTREADDDIWGGKLAP